MKGFIAWPWNCVETIRVQLQQRECCQNLTKWASIKQMTEQHLASAAFGRQWSESAKEINMTAIFLNGQFLMTLKMSPANARQAIKANFKDANELPLVFAEIPLL